MPLADILAAFTLALLIVVPTFLLGTALEREILDWRRRQSYLRIERARRRRLGLKS